MRVGREGRVRKGAWVDGRAPEGRQYLMAFTASASCPRPGVCVGWLLTAPGAVGGVCHDSPPLSRG